VIGTRGELFTRSQNVKGAAEKGRQDSAWQGIGPTPKLTIVLSKVETKRTKNDREDSGQSMLHQPVLLSLVLPLLLLPLPLLLKRC
jgi:hypothetical protein